MRGKSSRIPWKQLPLGDVVSSLQFRPYPEKDAVLNIVGRVLLENREAICDDSEVLFGLEGGLESFCDCREVLLCA